MALHARLVERTCRAADKARKCLEMLALSSPVLLTAQKRAIQEAMWLAPGGARWLEMAERQPDTAVAGKYRELGRGLNPSVDDDLDKVDKSEQSLYKSNRWLRVGRFGPRVDEFRPGGEWVNVSRVFSHRKFLSSDQAASYHCTPPADYGVRVPSTTQEDQLQAL